MKISARCDYACRALLELALRYSDNAPVHIHTISSNQAIPRKYLVQILIQLKRAGIVTSKRGQEGGYYLARHPARITLGEVIRTIDGPLMSLACLDKGQRENCFLERECNFKAIWGNLEQAMTRVVDDMTFEDICNNTSKDRAISYQI